jgi:hypothetical protein
MYSSRRSRKAGLRLEPDVSLRFRRKRNSSTLDTPCNACEKDIDTENTRDRCTDAGKETSRETQETSRNPIRRARASLATEAGAGEAARNETRSAAG